MHLWWSVSLTMTQMSGTKLHSIQYHLSVSFVLYIYRVSFSRLFYRNGNRTILWERQKHPSREWTWYTLIFVQKYPRRLYTVPTKTALFFSLVIKQFECETKGSMKFIIVGLLFGASSWIADPFSLIAFHYFWQFRFECA